MWPNIQGKRGEKKKKNVPLETTLSGKRKPLLYATHLFKVTSRQLGATLLYTNYLVAVHLFESTLCLYNPNWVRKDILCGQCPVHIRP